MDALRTTTSCRDDCSYAGVGKKSKIDETWANGVRSFGSVQSTAAEALGVSNASLNGTSGRTYSGKLRQNKENLAAPVDSGPEPSH